MKRAIKVSTPHNLIRRFDNGIVLAAIAELKRLLSVLPEVHEGEWAIFRIHAEIKAKIDVLQTGKMKDSYACVDEDCAALWAMQWLYRSHPVLFDDMGDFPPDALYDEWHSFEKKLC